MKQQIVEQIAVARKQKGYSQEVMAKKIGLTLRQYQRIEAGELPKYKTDKIKKIDEILETDIYDKIYAGNNTQNLENSEDESEQNYKDLYLNELVENKNLLKKLHETESHCRFLEEQIKSNLEISLSNQHLMMRQIAVASRLIVENISKGDPKKLQEGLSKIDRLIGAEAK